MSKSYLVEVRHNDTNWMFDLTNMGDGWVRVISTTEKTQGTAYIRTANLVAFLAGR